MGTRRMVDHVLVISVLVVLACSAADSFDESGCGEVFPRLRAVAEGKAAGDQSLTGDVAALRRELAIEKALWQDELDYLREQLVQVSGVSQRLDASDGLVQRRFTDIEALFDGDSPSRADVLDLVGSCDRRRSSRPSGPLSAAIVRPELVRRFPSLPRQPFPDGYQDPPFMETRRAAGQGVAKAEFVPQWPDTVQALADSLGGEPIALYNHVLQTIRPVASVGLMKGPAAVLATGRGNDAEQALLLAALFRASGYPARVAWGVQEIRIEALLDLYGANGVSELERILSDTGVAWEPVVSGGGPAAYRLERVWCEVWLPFGNFRGVVLDASSSRWLPLDPSLKNVEADVGVPVLDQMGFDGSSFVSQYLGGDFCGGNLDQVDACPSPREIMLSQVEQYVTVSGGALDEVTAVPDIEPFDEPLLPTAMVGQVVAVSGVGLELPNDLRHRVRIVGRNGGDVILEHDVDVATLAGHETSLWWSPADAVDEAIAAAYGGEVWRVPPHLIRLALELRVDGETIVRSEQGVGAGLPVEIEFVVSAPGGNSFSFGNAATSGVPIGLGIAPGASGYQPLFDEPGNTPELLASLTGRWLDRVADVERLVAVLGGGMVTHPYPTVASVSSVVRVEETLGIVSSVEWLGVAIDADVHGSRLVGDDEARRRWLEIVGLDASANERRLFEDFGVPTVSADLALILAARSGVQIHDLNQSNLGTILPTLPFSDEVLDDIEGWVIQGGEAMVPATGLSNGEWEGVGYRLTRSESGESRYQLSGRLSGGMTAAPPFDVHEDLRYPLNYPSTGYVNSDPASAVLVQKFDGDLQIGVVGETLSEENGAIPLTVRAFDSLGRPVKGATVEFQVLGGGGGFGAPGVGSTSSTTNAVGIATVDLTLGTRTDDNPYHLLYPDDEYATRCGLTVVTTAVNGHTMSDVFWSMAEPGALASVLQPRGASFDAYPHLSADPLVAVPADEYDNPLSNVEVTYALQASLGSDGEGPELLGREQKEQCRPGVIAAGECSGGSTSQTETGGVTGTWAYLVVGDDDVSVQATASSDTGSASATFIGHALTDSVPQGWAAGWPLLLVSRRGQPIDENGESVEAYLPGQKALPLQVSLFVIRENFTVVGCGSRHCTSGTGEFTTTRLQHGPVENCAPEGCSSGTITERGQVDFSGANSSWLSTIPDADGYYTHNLTMPPDPGRYEVTATPTIWVAVPRQPDDPDYINEIVPCPSSNDACGARLDIQPVSESSWRTTFTLWGVRPAVTTPVDVVKLGHKNLHLETQDFAFTVEPEAYPAKQSAVYFLEKGMVRMRAVASGIGTGIAQLPPGLVFNQPSEDHQIGVAVNPGWVWQPFPGEQVSMTVLGEWVDLPVIMADLDIDSNNDNGLDTPRRDDAEDAVEAAGTTRTGQGALIEGKVAFVNHNNDNLNDRPDYAELQVDGEKSMVPLVVEVRPEKGDWQGTTVVFAYDGPQPDQNPPQLPTATFAGDVIGSKSVYDYDVRRDYEYRDYSAVKIGSLRIWNIANQADARTSDQYIAPGQSYSAADLGFGVNAETKTFWVEAVNGVQPDVDLSPSSIELQVSYGGGTVEDTVAVVPIEGNLGVNNGNPASTAADGTFISLRPGVPDTLFTIDEHDEKIEDQGDGFRFWRSSDEWADESRIEDLAPLVIEVPQDLVDSGFEFWLKLESPEREQLKVARMPEGQPRLNHLKLEGVDGDLVHLVNSFGDWVLDGSHSHIENLEHARNELVFLAKPQLWSQETQINRVTLQLMARSPHGVSRPWVPIDSVRLTLAPIENFFAAYSVRGDDGAGGGSVDFDYPTEVVDGTARHVMGQRFPTAVHVDTAIPGSDVPRTGSVDNSDIEPYLVWLHGYNVSFKAAIDWGRVAAKRLFWVGYRGNFVLLTWKGDPPGLSGPAEFGLANEWALESSESVRLFFRDQMQQQWGVPAEKISVLAHSLGNLVMYDAMRLDQAHGHVGTGTAPTTKLFDTFISSEAAVWAEAFWPQQEVEYCADAGFFDSCVDITYSVRELQCSSWAFWFNQDDQRAWHSVNRIHHSYSPGDNVLTDLMRLSDWVVGSELQSRVHFDRPECVGDHVFRVPWRPTSVVPGPDYDDNPTLSPGEISVFNQRTTAPAMLFLDERRRFYSMFNIGRPVGAVPHPMIGASHPGLGLGQVDARDLGWKNGLMPTGGHSNCKDQDFAEIYEWWYMLVDRGGLPRGTEF